MNISVVIPCYNCSSTIIQCIESILLQSIPVYEIICIDDGSADNTYEIINKINITSSIPIKILKQENAGPSLARNRGVDLAEGELIAFLDSDDYWVPDKILQDLEILKHHPECQMISSSDIKKFKHKGSKVEFDELLYRNLFTTSCVLIKKDCFQKYRFDESKKYSEDYKLWLNIVYENECIMYYPRQSFPINHNYKNHLQNGLSAKLVAMEKGEIHNFYDLFLQNKISTLQLVCCTNFSIFKFIVRVFESKVKFLKD